jgi:hypothetical protein
MKGISLLIQLVFLGFKIAIIENLSNKLSDSYGDWLGGVFKA